MNNKEKQIKTYENTKMYERRGASYIKNVPVFLQPHHCDINTFHHC